MEERRGLADFWRITDKCKNALAAVKGPFEMLVQGATSSFPKPYFIQFTYIIFRGRYCHSPLFRERSLTHRGPFKVSGKGPSRQIRPCIILGLSLYCSCEQDRIPDEVMEYFRKTGAMVARRGQNHTPEELSAWAKRADGP